MSSSVARPGRASAVQTFLAAVRADHAAMRDGREKYRTEGSSMRSAGLVGDAVQKVGFQMMVAIRAMRLLRDLRVPLGAQVASRLIRHLYGAEIHWDAELAPGVSIVHGNGLVLSHGAVVGPHCILFQGVTLGESIDPSSREVGAPSWPRGHRGRRCPARSFAEWWPPRPALW